MKYIPKIFIETTVFNFYFEGKQGKKQIDAIRLFEEIARGRYEAFTSDAVTNELKRASGAKFGRMDALLQKYIKRVFDYSPEAQFLTDIYIVNGIIPEKFRNDAAHIATASVNNLDFVISFNQGHIVKTKTMIGAGFANLREGYRQIGLSTPAEVLEYDCQGKRN